MSKQWSQQRSQQRSKHGTANVQSEPKTQRSNYRDQGLKEVTTDAYTRGQRQVTKEVRTQAIQKGQILDLRHAVGQVHLGDNLILQGKFIALSRHISKIFTFTPCLEVRYSQINTRSISQKNFLFARTNIGIKEFLRLRDFIYAKCIQNISLHVDFL